MDEQPNSERDLGRLEGKTDILLATVSRMETDAKLAGQLINDRFVRNEEKIAAVEKSATESLAEAVQSAADDRQKIKDKLREQSFRTIVLAAAVGASQVSLKGIFIELLRVF